MQVLPSLLCHLSPSTFDDAIRAFVKSHPAFGAIPFRGTGGDLGKADAVEVKPFAITLCIKLVSQKEKKREKGGGMSYI